MFQSRFNTTITLSRMCRSTMDRLYDLHLVLFTPMLSVAKIADNKMNHFHSVVPEDFLWTGIVPFEFARCHLHCTINISLTL